MSDKKILRVYPAYIKDTADRVMAIDEQFLEVWAALGKSRTDTINEIFIVGLETIADRKELEGKVNKSNYAIWKKQREIEGVIARMRNLGFIYENMTLDEFQSFCNQEGIDAERFLENYKFDVPRPRTRTEIIQRWLSVHLADGKMKSVDSIREAAEREGIIEPDSEKEWGLIKSVASKEGYSSAGPRGLWRKLES
jgi:hypothetical protein